jgi:hypothetical protein
MRRLFRFLVRSSLLAAAGYAIKKVVASRQPTVTDDGWKAVEPPSPVPPPTDAPVVPVVAPEVVEVGDVDKPGEPEVDTEAARQADAKAAAAEVAEPAPVEGAAKKPAAKKAAPKKAAPAKKAAAKKAPAKKAAASKKPAAPAQPDDDTDAN